MDIKSGYKQTEVGVIPEDWDVKRLGELVDQRRKITYGIVVPGPETVNGVPLIRAQDYSKGWVSIDDLYRVSHKIDETYKRSRVRTGDVLLTIVGSVGNVASVPQLFNGSNITQQTARLSFNNEVANATYYHNLLLSDVGKRTINNFTKSGVQPSLNLSDVDQFMLPHPPLPEQKAIAQALSDMDSLISGLDDLIAKKRDIKQATMQQLLTGKTRLPGFSGDWEVKRLGDVVTLRKERADAKRLGCHDFCLELEHFGSGTGHLLGHTTTGHSATKSMFFEGDVLFGRLRAYLRKYWLATRAGVCSTEVWVLFSNPDAIRASFLFHVAQTDPFIDIAGSTYGTHMPRSDWNVVKNFELRLPLLPEQKAIAMVLTDMNEELTALEQRREKTRELKQAMMQELLTGRTRLV